MTHPNRGIAALLAAQGRNGDDELIHVNKRELAALERLGQRHGIQTTVNPRTGLKEAFNWASTAGAVLGGIGGTFAAPFTGGVINPYTGAALGSMAGTKLSGKSNEEALMNGVISGVTAWGMGGVSDALAEAGKEAGKTAVTEGVKTGVQEGAQGVVQEGAQNLAQQGTQNLFTQAGQSMNAPNLFTQSGEKLVAEGMTPQAGSVVGNNFVPTQAPMQSVAGDVPFEPFAKLDANAVMPDAGYYGAENIGSQGVNTYTSQGTKEMVAAGAPPGVTSSVAPGANTLTQSGTNADYWSNVGKGLGSLDTPGKAGEFAVANKGNLLASGLGAYGMATDVAAQPETTGGTTVDTSMPGVEVYYTPYGERRTRVIDRPRYDNVNMAEGGLTFSDYDAADVGSDGGYAPGGLACYANGGIARFGGGGILGTGWGEQNQGGFAGLTSSLQPGGALGEWHGKLYGALGADQVMPGGAMGSLIPGANQFNAKKREEEERKKKEEEEATAKAKAAAAFEAKWGPRYNAPMGMASGGVAQRFDRGSSSELDVTDLEHPAARYLRRAEAGGSPIVDKNVRGAAGRVGYNFPVGDTGNFNAGVSGYGMRAHAPGTEPVTRGQLTGVDLAYSPSQDRTISARYDAMAPASMPSYGGGYSAADFGGRPSEAQMMSMGPAPIARDRFSINYRQSFAEGGIANLGYYSDGGQLLRGPGDGVSDNIPATIEGKRPARLADGEFVIPARAVSELGNGSTEAGSKQLYKMLDRIAQKRKKGKGLAYNANPQKLMPV